ncbi:MAG: GTP pyrophosphokinase [Candidatus Marinimicrobia bacterium]|nr:GTP pyrophosphokinase [Candidatus Neomarinimicrobiota bacterium]
MLDKAIVIAVESHSGQVNSSGEPYVLHPIRMMIKAYTIEEMIIAVLHDVIEKTSIDMEYLMDAGFSDKVVQAIDSLSRRPEESYDNYIDRVSKNKLATKIKIIDLEDNMFLLDTDKLDQKISSRYLKYKKAIKRLT